VAAVEEERFLRIKHAFRFLPTRAARYCLDVAGIELDEVNYVVRPWANDPTCMVEIFEPEHVPTDLKTFLVRALPDHLFPRNRLPKIACVNHHLAHAASAYRCSGFGDAAIITMDGRGEWAATTLASGKGNHIEILRQFDVSQSLGFFYNAVTQFVGRVNGEKAKRWRLLLMEQPDMNLTIFLSRPMDIKSAGLHGFQFPTMYLQHGTPSEKSIWLG
jgi:carbamoyltransferase